MGARAVHNVLPLVASDRVGRVAGAAVRRVAILIELAREERSAHAHGGRELVFEELAAVLEGVLAELGDREAVAAADDAAVGGVHALAFTAGEHVLDLVFTDEAPLAGLAMLGVVIGVGEAQAMVRVEIPDQRRRGAKAIRVRGVRRIEAHVVEDVAVAVEVEAGDVGGADRADVGGRAGRLVDRGGAAAVRERVLVGRVERQAQVFAEVPQRLHADIARVRRVDAHAVVVRAARRIGQVVGVQQDAGNRGDRCCAFSLSMEPAGRRITRARLEVVVVAAEGCEVRARWRCDRTRCDSRCSGTRG